MTIVSRAIFHWKTYVPFVAGAVILNRKLRLAPGATLPETATLPTPQSWPTAPSRKLVLVVVWVPCVVSLTRVVPHVVVPVFDIVTVTHASSFGSIVIGTPPYDTNAELSAALAAPATNAKARNSPATARPAHGDTARPVRSRNEHALPYLTLPEPRPATANAAQRPAPPSAQAPVKAFVSMIAGAGSPGSFTYSRDSPVTVSTTLDPVAQVRRRSAQHPHSTVLLAAVQHLDQDLPVQRVGEVEQARVLRALVHDAGPLLFHISAPPGREHREARTPQAERLDIGPAST